MLLLQKSFLFAPNEVSKGLSPTVYIQKYVAPGYDKIEQNL